MAEEEPFFSMLKWMVEQLVKIVADIDSWGCQRRLPTKEFYLNLSLVIYFNETYKIFVTIAKLYLTTEVLRGYRDL